jgi:N utilization substance protein B
VSREAASARRHSRQAALQVLFAIDLAGLARSGPRPSEAEMFDRVAANFDLPAGAHAFAKALVCGTVGCQSELDALLAAHAQNWRISRMAAVDRNILRLACYELTRTDTPASVILDEAIELAHRFGSDASPGFVNGVLDAVARTARSRSGVPMPGAKEARR